MHGESQLGGALSGSEAGRPEVQTPAQAGRIGRGGDELGREPRALQRERRMDAQVAVDLAGLLELERAGDMGTHPAAIPPVEGTLVNHHHGKVLGVGDLQAILVFHAEHAGHRRRVGTPEADLPAIVCRQHADSLGEARRLAWAILAASRRRIGGRGRNRPSSK